MVPPLVVLGLTVAQLALPGRAAVRAFDHARHEGVSCARCHGAGPRHRTMLVRSARDCAGCHHDPARQRPCATCHAAPSPPREVTLLLQLSVWPAARARTLPFPHARHAALGCDACHRAPPMLAADRSCASCHDRHHREGADCAGCHRGAERVPHEAAAHLACAGAGCHASAVAATLAPRLAASRSFCVACHPAQRDHRAGGQCASCHAVPRAAAGLAATASTRGSPR